jgi:tetratricopeptide (TPR) repeat protein
MQHRHARACARLGLALLALLALSGPARAQQSAPPAGPDATQPPAAPDATLLPPAAEPASRLAEKLFAEGAMLFKQLLFEDAAQRFREALMHQDHPLIHLYLSRVLEKQGRLVEAHEALQPALRAGVEPPLASEDVQVAESLRQSLESRLAQVEVSCDAPGAEVFLDGEPWFTAPGRQRRMITAGQHVLMARKPGYFAVAEPVSLIPGKRTRVLLRMTADVVHVERRWQRWQPWTVAGAGLATSLAGGLLLWEASSNYAAIQSDLDGCKEKPSCAISTGRFDRAEWKERIGTGALIVGGSALAAGLAGLVLNLPRSWRSEPARGLEDLPLAPILSGDITGISARFQF